jgi:amidase
MATVDSMETTAGSLLLLGAKPSEEARLVQILREAGAVILGKTNLSEWAGFRTESGVHSWSSRGGTVFGAYCENMKSGGSSSGAAVATSLGLAAATIGSEVRRLSPVRRDEKVRILRGYGFLD